jgi:hypothetical protein
MKWIVTINTSETRLRHSHLEEDSHSHIDVGDPETAAVIINEINDARAQEGKGPALTHIDQYESEWSCVCGESRTAAPS